jgi:protease I
MARKILMIIAPDQFRDEELLVPRQAFLQQGWAVDTVCERTGQIQGMLGAVEKIDKDLAHAEAKAQKNGYDAVVVVGGMGSPEYLWNNAQIHRILQMLNKKGRVVSAICLSGAVLANAGLLTDRNATVWEMPESLEVFQQHGVKYTGEPVTVDGHFITANGPDAAADFAKAVIERVNALIPA